MESTGGGVGHAGVGWVMQRWSGVSHTGLGWVMQLKQSKKILVLRIYYYNCIIFSII